MNAFVPWIVAGVGALVLIVLVLYTIGRKRYARKKVAERNTEEKVTALNNDLEPFGFLYDENQDMVYSGMYPWQRELGYCRLYDEAALTLHMAIQSEPIYFRYNNRRWLIEFWKGQYGVTTGAEVGIYVTDKEDISIPGVFSGPFFDCVTDEERISMEFTLYRNHQPIITRKDLHWWLTGFDVGLFSGPDRLTMEIQLRFPDRFMANAFVKGLEEAGYGTGSYQIRNHTVRVVFEKPKTKQTYRTGGIRFRFVQWWNRFFCFLYRKTTKDYVKTLDKIDYLRFRFPVLYRILTKSIKKENLYNSFAKIKRHADAMEVSEK